MSHDRSNRSVKNEHLFILLVCCASLAAPALALKSDREQPIQIEADRLDVDDAKGTSVYKGNVRYVQGTIVITADEVHIFSTAQRELDKVLANGNPATFQQKQERNQQLIKGRAQQMEYRAGEQYLLMNGSAHIWQCGNEFSGSTVEYFVADETVRAAKDAAGSERVQVVIQPRNETAADDPCASKQVETPLGAKTP